MKKIFCVLISVMMCVCFSGCSDKPTPRTIANQVLTCFDNDDVEGLKSLFCEATLNEQKDLDAEIKEAFELYEGTSVDVGSITIGESKSVREGINVMHHASPYIPVEQTSDGKEYVISVNMYLVNKKEPETEGIYLIKLYTHDEEGEKVLLKTIGKELGI